MEYYDYPPPAPAPAPAAPEHRDAVAPPAPDPVCAECGDGDPFPNDDFCSELCRVTHGIRHGQVAGEVRRPSRELPLPLPAPLPRGLVGGRTSRPDGVDRHADTLPDLRPAGAARPLLPTDSDARKEIPIYSGVLMYFPLAIAAVARLSKRGNDKHNPGEPLHWAREKSRDHEDCIARHLIDVDVLDAVTGEYEDAAALAWRALAKLELLEEERLGKGPR